MKYLSDDKTIAKKETKPKWAMMQAILCDPKLRINPFRLRLMGMLVIHANNKTGLCYPSDDTLLDELGLHSKQQRNYKYYIRQAFAELVKAGWINKIEEKAGRRYIDINWDRVREDDTAPFQALCERTEPKQVFSEAEHAKLYGNDEDECGPISDEICEDNFARYN